MQHIEFPAVDDHVVVPEAGTEMINGEIRKVLPTEPPHGDLQCQIGYVLGFNVAPGYVASLELLTRVDVDNDFATDACIRKAGHDPRTGSRYLEELSFEVKHLQSEADIVHRASKLIRRGVRRFFAVHVREGEDEDLSMRAGPVEEWLPDEERWLELHPDAEIVAPCLLLPVPVKALLDPDEADDQVARALIAKGNPVIVEARRKTMEQALAEAYARKLEAQLEAHARKLEAQTRKATLELCDVLAIEVTDERRARMETMTLDELDALHAAICERRYWPREL